MGCVTSKKADASQSDEPENASSPRDVGLDVNEPVLLWLGKAEGLPSLDVLSESDVFVEAALVDAKGATLRKVKWPVKWDCNNPIWNSTRELGKPTAGCQLVLSIYDHDEAPVAKATRELIGLSASVGCDCRQVGKALFVQQKLQEVLEKRLDVELRQHSIEDGLPLGGLHTGM